MVQVSLAGDLLQVHPEFRELLRLIYSQIYTENNSSAETNGLMCNFSSCKIFVFHEFLIIPELHAITVDWLTAVGLFLKTSLSCAFVGHDSRISKARLGSAASVL